MPYAAPSTISKATTTLKSSDIFCLYRKNKDSSTTDNSEMSREHALQEVMEIISTSPQFSQFSTSPRRKSNPEALSKKHSLKVDLPSPLSQEFPCIIRKKSGEIVKSSLKKAKSEPPTPISAFPKYVHFGADLEQIKLFNESQRPQAVSVEASDDDDEDDSDEDDVFSFSPDEEEEEEDYDGEPELSVYLPNKPLMTTMHSSKPVFVENIFLSRDKKTLQGRIMVQNIAFQKSVHVRYTFDFWSTVSEVPASYAEGVPSKDNKNSFDVFVFSIDLIDNSRNPIDGKTMYFAVHYCVEGKDFWDNNDGSNFQVNFKRVAPPPKAKKNTQNLPSKWSMTPIQRPNKDMGESFCQSPPNLTSTTEPKKKSTGRYDIGVSLSAAQNAPRSALPIDNTRAYQPSYFPSRYGGENFSLYFPNNFIDGMPSELASSPSTVFEPLKPISNPISIPTSRPAIGSSSYYDLLNQYCFYSSSPPIFASS